MLFNSYVFVLLFLPLCVTGYFLLNRFKAEAANVFLLGMSLWFYGYLNPNYLAIICSSIVINYLLCLMMRRFGKETSAQGRRKGILILGILINLGILGYFKYADFFISNFNAVFRKDVGLLRIALPLGISFFTFQQISYVVDTYHDSASATDFITYACYVSFFPQLVAGPIVTQDEFLPQFQNPRNRKVNWDNVAHGSYLFVLGLAKKVMIADIFGQVVETGYTVIPDLNSPSAMFFIFSYTMQIYFDFSGYCDMAMGIGKMFNVELPVNFDSPYRAIGIADFWKRWHVTLTRFFTKYVYIPLGGNRKGQTLRERDDHFPSEWSVARRKLDLCLLGRSAWHRNGHGKALEKSIGEGAEADQVGSMLFVFQRDVSFFPGNQLCTGIRDIWKSVSGRLWEDPALLYGLLCAEGL